MKTPRDILSICFSYELLSGVCGVRYWKHFAHAFCVLDPTGLQEVGAAVHGHRQAPVLDGQFG